jgi:hypothetical protein
LDIELRFLTRRVLPKNLENKSSDRGAGGTSLERPDVFSWGEDFGGFSGSIFHGFLTTRVMMIVNKILTTNWTDTFDHGRFLRETRERDISLLRFLPLERCRVCFRLG